MSRQRSRSAPQQPRKRDAWKEDIQALLSPGYVERLRARDARDLLLANGGISGLTAVIGAVVVTVFAIDKHESLRVHLDAYAGFLALALVAVTASVALRPRAMLRPGTALRIHALLLLCVGVELAAYLTRVALFAPRPLHSFHWVPFVSPMLTTYAVALVAATWCKRRARYLTSVVGALVFAWDLFLLAEVLLINP